MRKQRAERLRFAVNSLPPETQRAMLAGLEQNRIVTGANSDRRGGVCPMLAADRNAFEVTPLAEIFATAWDKYTGTSFVNVNRRAASERDLKVLRSMLETSLELSSGAATELAVAVSEIRAAPAPQSTPSAGRDLAEASRAHTANAKLEIRRALRAAAAQAPRQAAPRPAARVGPAAALVARVTTPPAPRSAARVEPAVAPLAAVAAASASRPTPRVSAAESDRYRAAPAARPATRATPPRATAADSRAPASKSQAELERERARAIIANQASTLRPRAWPRPAQPTADAQRASAAPAPAAAPGPSPAPIPTPLPQLGDRDRRQELQARSGWAWLRPFSSFEDYEQTLHDLGEMQRAPRSDDPRAGDGGTPEDATRRQQRSPA